MTILTPDARALRWLPLCASLMACGDSEGATSDSATVATSATMSGPTSQGTTAHTGGASDSEAASTSASSSGTAPGTSDPTSAGSDATGSSAAGSSTGDPACGAPGYCDQPNQVCDQGTGECTTLCQGQLPDPCAPDQVCDVISGTCKDPEASCTLFGDYGACEGQQCGPGTTCDGMGACIPIAPCNLSVCTDEGMCWGAGCSCTRTHQCGDQLPDEAALNGPFSTEITDLEFADDCTAWMVTLRSGTDYVRRLTPAGELTEWAGVSNLDMGEIKVLKALSIPQSWHDPGDEVAAPVPAPVEGLGEVAITYICCANCGCFVDPPQGVARLDEDAMQESLPIVITATVTQGTGPFGFNVTDAGPQGLSWGEDRVLYVGHGTRRASYA